VARVAVLGCGRWGQNHLKTLHNLRNEGIVDTIHAIDVSKRARDASTHADYVSEKIDHQEIDLVIIATPSKLHAAQAKELMEKGYHVLVEKPLGCCEAEAAQVLVSAQENGRMVSVGLLLRFHPAVQTAKRMISNGKIGRIESLRFVRRTERPAPHDGNVIESLGVHAIDLMCHLMNESEPSAVNVQGDRIDSRIILEYPMGIEALIDVAWDSSEERRLVKIIGSTGTLIFDLNIHDRLTLITSDEKKEIQCDSYHTPLEGELRHALDGVRAVKRGKPWSPVPDYGAALRGVRWTERAILAMPVSRQIQE
tara:strand:+ start:2599 stop:3528 length:930 start_codon:yes stop_codon:yes gene_type:complete